MVKSRLPLRSINLRLAELSRGIGLCDPAHLASAEFLHSVTAVALGVKPHRVPYGNLFRTQTTLVWPVSTEQRTSCLSFCNHALGGVDSKDSLLGANQIQSCFWEAVLGVKSRLVLSDAAWERMAPLIIGRPDQKGSTGRDNRMFVEGVLWIVRTGSPWRDLPEAFGDWNSVFRRFSRWSVKGVWWRIFEAMSDDPDFEYLIVDSTIVRAHQHAAGAKKGGLKIRRSAARAVV
jgi:transposase